MADEITIEVGRFNPETDSAPKLQSYTIPFRDDMVVLDALNYIKGHVDGTLSYRWSCRMGICGSCGMMVNGYPKLTCSAFLRDYHPRTVKVEPLANFPVIKDLVIDMGDFMSKLTEIKPWIVRHDQQPLGAGPLPQTPAQVDAYHQFSQCINCMLCYAACPVYAMEPLFLGPAAIALARRYTLDSRDQGGAERYPVVMDAEGIWECTFVGECSAACPKGVDPAKAIQQTKFDSTNQWVMGLLMPWGRDSGNR